MFEDMNRNIYLREQTVMHQIEFIDETHNRNEHDLHLEINKVVASGVLKEPKRQTING